MSFLSLSTADPAQPQRHLHFPSLVNFHTFLWAAFRMHILTNKQIRRRAPRQGSSRADREKGRGTVWLVCEKCLLIKLNGRP